MPTQKATAEIPRTHETSDAMVVNLSCVFQIVDSDCSLSVVDIELLS